MTKTKQSGNPKFYFLFGGPHYDYYRFRVKSEQTMLRSQESGPGPQQGPPQFTAPMGSSVPPGHFAPPPPHLMPPSVTSAPYSPKPQPPNFLKESPLPGSNQFSAAQHPLAPTPFSAANPNSFNRWPQPFAPPPNNSILPADRNDDVAAEIAKLQDQVKESEANLAAQHKTLLEDDKRRRIEEEVISKQLDDELKRMCEDFNINLNEFDKVLQPIIETCRKESIAVGIRDLRLMSAHHVHLSEWKSLDLQQLLYG